MSAKTYDPACYTLAEHFLPRGPELEGLRDRLAAHIQTTIEDWLEYESKQVAEELGVTTFNPMENN